MQGIPGSFAELGFFGGGPQSTRTMDKNLPPVKEFLGRQTAHLLLLIQPNVPFGGHGLEVRRGHRRFSIRLG